MKKALANTLKTYKRMLPLMFGILLLINLISPFLKNYYTAIFTGNYFLDPLIGALAGSISFGIPITSFIISGELIKQGISLLAVSAFMLTWATVGVAMLPLEISFLGRRFAIYRNLVNFFFGIIIAILTILTLNLIA
jgi:hypothetical protein